MLLLLFSLVAAPPTPQISMQGFLDAPQLVGLCRASGDQADAQRAICLGYVAGAVDAAMAHQARRGRRSICPPADLTIDGVAEAVVLTAGPPDRVPAVAAASLVRSALEARFPCASGAAVAPP